MAVCLPGFACTGVGTDAFFAGAAVHPFTISSSTASHFLAGCDQDRSWLMQALTISLNLPVEYTCAGKKAGKAQAHTPGQHRF